MTASDYLVVERLEAKVEELRAEIERLNGEVKCLHETIGLIDRQHAAENKRLRALLLRHQVAAWCEEDSDLAVETRAAIGDLHS